MFDPRGVALRDLPNLRERRKERRSRRGMLDIGGGDELDLLGKKVEEHIRKEERILFPFIEQVTPAEILAEMNSALRH